MNLRGSLVFVLLALPACKNDPPAPVTPTVAASADRRDAGEKMAPEDLEAAIDRNVESVEDWFARCSKTMKDAATLDTMKRARTEIFADRDEVAIRKRRSDWATADIDGLARRSAEWKKKLDAAACPR